MGKDSAISWTHHTFNPWVGCQRVSPGCQHCYAEALDQRWRPGNTRWGPKAERTKTSAAYWRQPLAWDAAAAKAGRRDRVFCASLADVFEDRPELEPWRVELFELIRVTPHLDWLLLTKRPENVMPAIADVAERCNAAAWEEMAPLRAMVGMWRSEFSPRNVWLGTTVEDQQRAEERIPKLLAVPAKKRFLSCEPLLEGLELGEWLESRLIDWVICGGESGSKARPFHAGWAHSLLAQCRRAEVAFFMKQFGAHAFTVEMDHEGWSCTSRLMTNDRAGADPAEWPAELRVQEFP